MTTTTLRRINLDPVNYAHAFNQMKQSEILSTEEDALFEALRKVDTTSLWGEAILDMFIDYTPLKFRELVCELLSQQNDCGEIMYQILGKEAFDALLKLRP